MTKLEIRTRYSETDEPDKNGRWARLVYYNNKLIAWISMDKNVPNYYLTRTFFPVHDNDMPLAHDHFETYQQAIEWVEYHWNQFYKSLLVGFEFYHILMMNNIGAIGMAAHNAGKSLAEAAHTLAIAMGNEGLTDEMKRTIFIMNEAPIGPNKTTIEQISMEIKALRLPEPLFLKIPDTRPFYHNLDKNKKKRRY